MISSLDTFVFQLRHKNADSRSQTILDWDCEPNGCWCNNQMVLLLCGFGLCTHVKRLVHCSVLNKLLDTVSKAFHGRASRQTCLGQSDRYRYIISGTVVSFVFWIPCLLEKVNKRGWRSNGWEKLLQFFKNIPEEPFSFSLAETLLCTHKLQGTGTFDAPPGKAELGETPFRDFQFHCISP